MTDRAADDPDPGLVGVDDDVALRLYLAIGRLVRLMRRDVRAEVGPGSLSALVTLDKWGPLRLGDLAARESVAPPTLTRIVSGLQEAGYLARYTDPTDRRVVLVAATDAGRELLERVREARAAALRHRIAGLARADRAALLGAVAALEALVAEEGSPAEPASPTPASPTPASPTPA